MHKIVEGLSGAHAPARVTEVKGNKMRPLPTMTPEQWSAYIAKYSKGATKN